MKQGEQTGSNAMTGLHTVFASSKDILFVNKQQGAHREAGYREFVERVG